MPLEVEWRYLVTRLPQIPSWPAESIEQAYLNADRPALRIRIADNRAFLTIKIEPHAGAPTDGPAVRREFTWPIAVDEARELIASTPRVIRKTRYRSPEGLELDVFHGALEGLVIAELEVPEGGRPPACPAGWEWRDISQDRRYSNQSLASAGLPPDAVLAGAG